MRVGSDYRVVGLDEMMPGLHVYKPPKPVEAFLEVSSAALDWFFLANEVAL